MKSWKFMNWTEWRNMFIGVEVRYSSTSQDKWSLGSWVQWNRWFCSFRWRHPRIGMFRIIGVVSVWYRYFKTFLEHLYSPIFTKRVFRSWQWRKATQSQNQKSGWSHFLSSFYRVCSPSWYFINVSVRLCIRRLITTKRDFFNTSSNYF